jgi:hypothetical protein
MKTNALALMSVAVFALGVNPASAGPCTTEIDSLTKTLAAKDAGSGPTPGAGAAQSASPPSAQHPPTQAMSQASSGTATSPQDVRGQTAGQAPQQGAREPAGQHPPTAAMGQATESQRAPATAGQHPPTAAMSEATQQQGAPPASATGQNTSEASLALNRARMLDQQGNEAECMRAVQQARQLAGR